MFDHFIWPSKKFVLPLRSLKIFNFREEKNTSAKFFSNMASFLEEYEDLNATEDAMDPDAEVVHFEEDNRDGNVDLEALIELVRSLPILWNTKLRGYKETNKKNTAWNQVALHLGCDVSICRAKWKNIRDTYKKCIKRRDLATRSGAGYKRLPECRFFKELQFLSDSVTSKETESNFTFVRNDEGQSSAMDIKTAEVPSDKSIPVPLSVSSPARSESPNTSCQDVPAGIPIKRKKLHTREREDISTALDLELISHLKKKNVTENDQNIGKSENELFCKSLIPILDRFDNKTSQMAKVRIQQLLFEIEFGKD